jgi:hypothetical protein
MGSAESCKTFNQVGNTKGKEMSEREQEDIWRAIVINHLQAAGPTKDRLLVEKLTTPQGECPAAIKQCQLAGTLLDLHLEGLILITGQRDNYTISLP